jgi:PAS domain S-box-containing protein
MSDQPTFEDMKLLTEVSQLLTLLDLDGVMRRVIQLMSSSVGAAKASLFLHDENDIDWDHILLTRQLDHRQSVNVVRTVMDEGLAGWVTRNRQGAVVYDTQQDERWKVFPDDTNRVRSALCVPFMHDDKVLAVLTLVHPEPQHFDEHHLRLMTIVANQAAVAVRNAQLFHQVQNQQRQLAEVLRVIPDVLLVLNEDGKILIVNDAGQKLLDDNTGVEGRYINEFVDTEAALAPLQRVMSKRDRSNSIRPFETRSDRTNQDFLVNVSRWENPSGRGSGYVVVMHDVTTLRDLHRFKDEMIKVVSHDLMNPVSLVASASEMLEMDMPKLEPGSAIPQYMSIIRQATDRMQGLLDDLLRAETSNQRPIEPAELVSIVMENMLPLAQKKSHKLTAQVEVDEALEIVVDPMLVREAMENYVSNAIKYTPDGGRIAVRLFVQGERLHYTVEDNGIGIAPEHLSHLFEPYYRVERPETTDIEGYGVGLNLVKTIIERHKGQVWVESTIGVGSRFGFDLPL